MQKIKLTENTFLSAIQKLSELQKNFYSVTATVFHTAVESNFLELFEKNGCSLHQTKKELEIMQDPHFKNEFSFNFLEESFELKFERNEGKNSLKFFSKQLPKNRQFLPFGSDVFVSEQNEYAVVVYTRKDSKLTEVFVFTTMRASDYLSRIVYNAKHKVDS
jgi:hypothetical protein